MGIVPRHEVFSFDVMPEFVYPLVKCPSGFTDIHEEVFTNRADAVETGFFGDNAEFFFTGSEGYPWGPVQGAPIGGEEVQEYQTLVEAFSLRVSASAGKFRTCILRWQFGQRATVFSIRSFPSFESHSM